MNIQVLFSNYNTFELEQEAREWLEETHSTEEITDDLVYDVVEDWNATHFQAVVDSLSDYFYDNFHNQAFLVTGNLGRWNGNFDGGFVTDDFKQALSEISLGNSYMTICDNNGHLLVEIHHHDGVNYWEFKVLTEQGRDLIDIWEYDWEDKRTEREVHTLAYENDIYSELPKYWEHSTHKA